MPASAARPRAPMSRPARSTRVATNGRSRASFAAPRRRRRPTVAWLRSPIACSAATAAWWRRSTRSDAARSPMRPTRSGSNWNRTGLKLNLLHYINRLVHYDGGLGQQPGQHHAGHSVVGPASLRLLAPRRWWRRLVKSGTHEVIELVGHVLFAKA